MEADGELVPGPPPSVPFLPPSAQTDTVTAMLRGMTGYGRSTREEPSLRISVEVRTVNHRYSEVAVRLPRNLLALEGRLRRQVSERLGRGRADVSIHVDRSGGKVIVS